MGSEGRLSLARMPYSSSAWNFSGNFELPSMRTPRNSPSTHSCFSAIRFSVSVPVLSTHSTVAAPNVSIAGMRRVSTPCRAMRQAPSARNTVSTTGYSLGMMVIASVTAASSAASQSLCCQP